MRKKSLYQRRNIQNASSAKVKMRPNYASS